MYKLIFYYTQCEIVLYYLLSKIDPFEFLNRPSADWTLGLIHNHHRFELLGAILTQEKMLAWED